MVTAGTVALYAVPVLALGLVVQPAAAQQSGSIELGGDAGLEVALFPDDAPNVTTVSLPVQRFRAGFWLTDQVSLEPGVRFDWFDVADESLTLLRFDGSVLYHFGSVGAARPYVRGGGVFDWIRVSDNDFSDSATQFGAGGGVGVKAPLTGNLSFRAEGGVTRFFENDDFTSSTNLNGLVGLSVFIN